MNQFPRTDMQIQGIRCILFDLAETLWINKDKAVWTQVVQIKNQEAAELLKVYFPTEVYQGTNSMQLSTAMRAAIAARYTHWRHHSYDKEPDPFLIVAEACQQLHVPVLNEKQVHYLLEAYREPLPATRQLFADALPTLQELRARGYLLGCVTDRQFGGPSFLADLEELGLLTYFPREAIVISADCGQRKPHPQLFMQALIALQVHPEETAMVGDFLSRDVAGAKRLNMTAIWKPKPRVLREISFSSGFLTDVRECQKLLTYTLHQEEAMYPEVPFHELESFMKPDYVIEHLHDLLSLFTGCSQ